MMAPPSLSLYTTPAERYTVLLDLARSLATNADPSQLYEIIQTQVRRVLPTSAFSVLVGANGDRAAVFHTGPAAPGMVLTRAEEEQLRAGDFVLRAGAGKTGMLLLAPLVADRRVLGCIAAARGESRPFDAADAHFLLAVGRLAGTALENLRRLAEARRRTEEAELLATVSRDLSASLELEDVAARLARRAQQLTRGPATLWIVDGRRLRVAATAGTRPESLGEERRLPDDALELPEVLGVRPRGEEAIPLVSSDRLVGALVIGEQGRPPKPRARALIEKIAGQAAATLENARLHAEVRRLSLTDPLCRLPNRRQLGIVLEREFFAAQRGRLLCLVLYDLDHFKEYNDTRGHQAGDAALVRFANVLRAFTRAMNLPARYGGEEFAAVLSDTTLQGGRIFAEKVRRRLAVETGGALTVSAGVAAFADWMRHPSELLAAADRALYRAKAAGRDRVCVADPRPPRG